LIPKTTTISGYREVSEAHRGVVRDEVKRLLEAKTIIPAPDAFSPYVSPVVVVPKKDEHGLLTKRRMCVDYRALNKRTIRDQYALPNLESCLHLRKGVIFSKVDLASAYHQIPVALQDQVKTGFIVDRQVYLWRYMPFGLSNAPATMQRLIDKVLGSAKDNFAQGYLDDIIVYSENEEKHVKHLAEIFGKLDHYGLRIGLSKCEFGMSKILFLGHLISHGEISIDPSKVEDAKKLARPTSVKELQSFLGVTGWCRKFIYNYAGLSAPLTNLLRKETRWVWGEAQERAWKSLKDAIVKAPVLIQPNFEKLFVLETDASDEGIGGVLLQRSGSDEKSAMKPIAYVSRKLTSAERQYSTREKECLAIVWGTERLKMYLWGRVFAVLTDHRSLQWIQQVMYDNSRIGRWARKLSSFEFDIKFRAGSQNQLADGLSRAPLEEQRSKSVLVLMRKVLVNTRAQAKRTPAQQAAAEVKQRAVEQKKAERKSKAPVGPSPTEPQDKAAERKDAKSELTQHGLALPKGPPSKSGPSVQVEPSGERKVSSIPPSTPKDRVERDVPAPESRVVQGERVARSKTPSAGVVVDAKPPVAETAPTGVPLTLEPMSHSNSPEVRSEVPQEVSADDGRGGSSVRLSGVPEYRLSRAPTGSGSELDGRSVRRRVREPSGDRAVDPGEVHDTPRSSTLAPTREEMLSEDDDHSVDQKRGMTSERDEKKVEVFDDLDELDSAKLDLSSLLSAESKKMVESKVSGDKKFEIPDKETWRRLLRQDPTYGQIIRYITGENVPKSRTDRDRLNTIKAKYVYEQGLLYFRRALDDGSERLIAEVPEVCRRNLVQAYHDMATAGHRGAEAMVKQIRMHYNWPSLRRDVREYAQQCLKCWLAKTPASSRAGLLVQWGTRVEKFAVVHIDFVGPLPFIGKKDEKYVLTMKDRGTGMIEAVPVENRTAEVAASALWRYWFCRFGIPKVLVSDRDGTFGGTLFKCLSEQLGYDISRTTAYHPQSNGMLERDHRTFKAFLNTCCLGTPSMWPERLSSFCFVVNSTPRDHFTYSPFFLAFGVDPRLPAQALDRNVQIHDIDDYVAGLLLQLSESREAVIRERVAAEARQKKQYDRFRTVTNFEVGDIVFKRMDKGRGTAAKFHIPWTGPYKIIKKSPNGADWTIENADKDQELVHVQKLAAFKLNTEIPLTISEDMSPEEEAITKVLEDWRKDRYAEDYGHAFSLERNAEQAVAEEKAEEEVKPLQPQLPASGVELDLKEGMFLLVAAKGYEDLVQVVLPDPLQCRVFKPVSKNDTGSSRSFAKLYFDRGDGNYWVTNTLSAKIAERCEEVIQFVNRDQILLSFEKLDRRSIPAVMLSEFKTRYGRTPKFRQQA